MGEGVCMYMIHRHIYGCGCLFIFIYINTHTYTYTYSYFPIYACTYINTHTYLYMTVYTYLFISAHVWVVGGCECMFEYKYSKCAYLCFYIYSLMKFLYRKFTDLIIWC
jgi:hypothetical protein